MTNPALLLGFRLLRAALANPSVNEAARRIIYSGARYLARRLSGHVRKSGRVPVQH